MTGQDINEIEFHLQRHGLVKEQVQLVKRKGDSVIPPESHAQNSVVTRKNFITAVLTEG